ncbi:heparan-alpha-glucosaminide N-acetyltransferase domain-containing protein [Georgenia ruanii]|uniref:DUF1624 domain-containing protein n=1 Tax=Georgenia ruanii TaxID=348442 RepID=A0A7J9V064_9MICO|nr:heparan-alpha-glucosaminide N-acetyltransferase domain-containing protein [Georgenia ruanii]MPV90072.1 DUF1624 domain-containing protein [Georgenia ruanii]
MAPSDVSTVKRRLVGVDATRGLALVGIMSMHTLPTTDAAGHVTWTAALAGGRMAATFALLAGVGIAFLSGRRPVPPPERRGVAAALATRALLIGGIGLALGFADPDNIEVILPYYGLLFLLAIPLTYLSTRAVAVTGAVVAVGVPVLSHVARSHLPPFSGANPTFAHLVGDPVGQVIELLLTGAYPVLSWMTYICAGLVVGRLPLSSPRVAARLLGWGLGLALIGTLVSRVALGPLGGRHALYAAAAASGLPGSDVSYMLNVEADGTTPTSTWWWLVTDAAHTNTPVNLLHSTGVAVALLGAFLLLTDRVAPRGAAVRAGVGVLAAAGSMTLTLYSAHVVATNALGATDLDPAVDYLGQVAVALLFALVWRRRVGQGPLEAQVSRAARAARRAVAPPVRLASGGPNGP